MSPRAASTRSDRLRQRRARRVAFAGQRDQRRGIAQRRAVVGAAELQHRLRREAVERCGIDPLRPVAIADQRQRCRQLRFRDRRRQVVQLGIGEIAQVADRRCAIARQHVEAVGEITSAVLFRLVGVDHRIADAVERVLEQHIRYRKSLFAGAGQEVRHVSIQPGVVAAGRPQPERPVRSLPRQQPVDRHP